MIKILSWNIRSTKKGLTPLLKRTLAEVVNENEIDIVVLQEAFGKMVNTSLNSQVNSYEEILCVGNIIENGVRIFLKKDQFTSSLSERHFRNKLMLSKIQKVGDHES